MCEIFGYSKAELERMSVNSIALPDDLSISPDYIHRALEGADTTTVFEKRYRHRDGHIVHGLVSSSLVRDGQGRPRCFISQVQDISERKRQEAQLELQRQQLIEANRALAEARDVLAEGRTRLQATLDALLDPHVLLGPVRDGAGRIVDFRFLEANPAACAYNGLPCERLLGSSLLALLPAHGATGLLDQYRAVIETGQPLVLDDVVYPHEIHQEERRFDIRAVKVGDALSYTWRDVTERHRSAQRLAASEEHYRLLAENSGDVVLLLDDGGRIRWVSPSLTAALGWTPEEWIDQPGHELLSPRGEALQSEANRERLRQGETLLIRQQVPARDGRLHWIAIHANPFRRGDGPMEGVVVTFHTIDAEVAAERELQAANRELELLATTDALTGLWNRRQLDARVRCELDRADRYGDDLALVLFDIDHFKAINDRFGHPAGDRVLVELARRARAQLRESDGLGRWGGEEFLVLMPHSSGEEARQLAEKLRRLVAAAPIAGVGTVTASFGVAQRRPLEPAEAWFRRVDGALYRAKQAGRNRVELEPELREPLPPLAGSPGRESPGAGAAAADAPAAGPL